MDIFKVEITKKAASQLEACIDYIQYTLLNEQAAESVWQDAAETARRLSFTAGSLKYCSDPILKDLGYKIISFRYHEYIMIYHIENKTVYVDAVYHRLQDYENIFAGDIKTED